MTHRRKRPSLLQPGQLIRAHPWKALGIYLALILASNVVQLLVPREWYMLPSTNRVSVQTPAFTEGGETGQRRVTVSAIAFGAPADASSVEDEPPVILLHGSPGQATDYTELGPVLGAGGRRVYALDMPGFGLSTGWVPNYSARAYARYVLAFMDQLGIERAHLVGWSNGGAVVLNAAEIGPDRLASVTLLAAIACQETEGTGDFYFEHAKYALGYAAVVGIPELIPHFGFAFPREYRHAFIRNFWDTDQRPIRAIMESLDVPLLILHGRHDPLVSDRAALRHHELVPNSKLVMTEHSHFLPFMQPDETASHLEPFFARHDEPGMRAEPGTIDLSPQPERSLMEALMRAASAPHWAFSAVICAILARLRRETATAFAGLLTASAALDFGVAFLGLLIGRAIHPREPWLQRDLGWIVGLPIWTGLSLLIAQSLASPWARTANLSVASLILIVLVIAILLNTVKLAPTRGGRRRIVATLRRFLHHEWWPAPVLYVLVLPSLIGAAFRHRSLTVWTCLNPGIKPGGGVAGESKQDILRGFSDPRVLTQHIVDEDTTDKVEAARHLVRTEPGLGGFPLVVKPDAGQRGAGVTLVRTDAELADAVSVTGGSVAIQRYHSGPVEVGVFWVRDRDTIGAERTDTRQGWVFAVTKKVFPEIVGDGESTRRELVLAHPRFRMQARVYLEQLGSDLEAVPDRDQHIVLTRVGNHAKGCRFEDGADLITPELEDAIDELARTWQGPDGERFDYGRFDIRSESEDALRSARDIAIIELNGVTSEATNLYDPSWNTPRAIRLLARQWSIAFELGQARRDQGVRPMSIQGLFRVALSGS